jgi:hypothetical protein
MLICKFKNGTKQENFDFLPTKRIFTFLPPSAAKNDGAKAPS